MPTCEFKVRFNLSRRDVTISFADKLQASAYASKTPKSTPSPDRHSITLPQLEKLDHIRCSDSTHDLVFVFLDDKAATAWYKDLALASVDGKEVRIKRTWGKGKLDEELGINKKSRARSPVRRSRNHSDGGIGSAQPSGSVPDVSVV